MSVKVAAIVPTWNRADLLASALASLSRQDYPIAETIVVDDGSVDNSVAAAKAAGAKVLSSPTNVGFSASVNKGLRQTSCDWVLVLNNDVELTSNWVRRTVTAATDAGAGYAVGKMMCWSDRKTLDGTFDLVARGGLSWRAGHGSRDSDIWHQSRPISGASFTALLGRRSVFERVGGLDERFGSYLEDVDWSLRCVAAGISGVYVPGAVAYHRGSATLGMWTNATVRLISRNQVFIYAKHLRGPNLRAAVVGQLLWIVLAASRGTGVAAIRGKLDALREFRAWSEEPASWPFIEDSVIASERELFELQSRCGFDKLWRWYFRLAGGPCIRSPR